MPGFHLGPAGDAFAGGLGVATAALLVGGSILLRWQRNKHHFLLARTAMEKGITDISPLGVPEWVRSMRHGVMTLVLGIGLLIVGAGGAVWSRHRLEGLAPEPATRPIPGERPTPNPKAEEWHRAQGIHTAGFTAVGCGAILTLLGVTRTLLARSERRWSMAGSKPSVQV